MKQSHHFQSCKRSSRLRDPDLAWLGMMPLSISCRSVPMRMASHFPSLPRCMVSTTLNTSPLVKLRPMGESAS